MLSRQMINVLCWNAWSSIYLTRDNTGNASSCVFLSITFSIIHSFNARNLVFSIAHFLGKNSEALSSSMVVNVIVTSAVEVSGAIIITTTEGFSSVVTSMVSPGVTITVGSSNRSSIAVQASPSATTPGSSGATSFTSRALPSVQVSVEPTAASTVKLTTISSVNGK